MLVETLKNLIVSGNHALQTTAGLQVHRESVNQIRHGSVTFPSLGAIKITRGALQRIHLGCNSDLGTVLMNLVEPETERSGIDVLLESFLARLLDEMDSRNPKGEILNLGIGTQTLYTRGVRSFGFRLETDMGHLFLLAEVPSKLEYEEARGSEFLDTMISTFLPKDWNQREALDSSQVIDSFLVLLRKAEADVELEFPRGEDEYSINSGMLLDTVRIEGRHAVRMSVDLSSLGDQDPQKGDEVIARFGLKDRSLRFNLRYLGRSSFPIAGEAALSCLLFEVPDCVYLEQRRRAFRINVSTEIPVEIEDLSRQSDPFHPRFGSDADPLVRGHLADLSFSGARIIAEGEQSIEGLAEGSRVLCRVFFPGHPYGHEVHGVIRRSTTSLIGRDHTVADVGVEFLSSPEMDRTAIDVIRQYVLSEQRRWLARRVNVVT